MGNWPLTSSRLNDTRNCASWNAQFMRYNTELRATILQNDVLHFLAYFLWRFFHWPTWTIIVFNRFPTPLKLLGSKLYFVVGRWNITIYSIHPFMDFFRLFPSFMRNLITERSSKSLVFIVDPHAIALAILSLPALWSDWFLNVAATCQVMSQPAYARSRLV